jgi:hypothetical protein
MAYRHHSGVFRQPRETFRHRSGVYRHPSAAYRHHSGMYKCWGVNIAVGCIVGRIGISVVYRHNRGVHRHHRGVYRHHSRVYNYQRVQGVETSHWDV